MRFSSRVDISEPNPIAVEEAAAKRQGVTLGKLNDSNPTRHGLAPASVPEVYSAEPKGQRYAGLSAHRIHRTSRMRRYD